MSTKIHDKLPVLIAAACSGIALIHGFQTLTSRHTEMDDIIGAVDLIAAVIFFYVAWRWFDHREKT